ncbi:MarR family winged helix-turn-helix transcriptional regulator [Ancylobacter sp. SL191]|uniref:MarR family winged helix-turn-helix transcriptional regulator n=1 Tax=Ancylobacter sp. SL191 TaxID=2995166 RepID=UPI00226E1548|nr:MarR family transcriptional regulator [Ancylobacter sp. SL191]WAC27816.1 MarR family transcriptional regulator [Ancylobacter sp. SL191]
MSNDETLKLDHFICFAVYSANHAFNRVYKPILDRLGLTYPQFIAMVTLWTEDGLTVGQIGERVLLETNTLTPLLKRLESAGHVRRVRDAADERQVRIFLTDKGRALRAEAEGVPTEIGICLDRDPAAIAELTGELTRMRNTLLARVKP